MAHLSRSPDTTEVVTPDNIRAGSIQSNKSGACVKMWQNDKISGWVPKVDVVATLRPDLPWPTTPTILGYPESCFEFKSNSDRIKRMQKRFEFGTLTPFGDDNRMCLSVAQKSVAIVDVARATVAEWFPLREPETIARGNFASSMQVMPQNQ